MSRTMTPHEAGASTALHASRNVGVRRGLRRCTLVAAALAGAACPVQAALLLFDSDAAFLAGPAFTKVGGANVRWGNGATNGDWEYAIVNASDVPVAGAQGQLAWPSIPVYGAGTNDVANMQFSYSFGASGLQTLTLRDVNSNVIGDIGAASGTVALPAGGVNTLAVRAKASSGDYAAVGSGSDPGFRVNFTSGGFFDIGRLAGDANAEYAVLVDERLAGGFAITDLATLHDGRGSDPMWQFKVGISPIPLPSALPLLALGLGASGLLLRRRRPAKAWADRD